MRHDANTCWLVRFAGCSLVRAVIANSRSKVHMRKRTLLERFQVSASEQLEGTPSTSLTLAFLHGHWPDYLHAKARRKTL
jgi:hypothetical protein